MSEETPKVGRGGLCFDLAFLGLRSMGREAHRAKVRAHPSQLYFQMPLQEEGSPWGHLRADTGRRGALRSTQGSNHSQKGAEMASDLVKGSEYRMEVWGVQPRPLNGKCTEPASPGSAQSGSPAPPKAGGQEPGGPGPFCSIQRGRRKRAKRAEGKAAGRRGHVYLCTHAVTAPFLLNGEATMII